MVINPVPKPTIGQTVDARLATIEHWFAVEEANLKVKEAGAVAWIKGNWLHVANAGLIATTALKVFGKL